MRNAWRTIAAFDRWACVFEDDIEYDQSRNSSDLMAYVCANMEKAPDVLFLGNGATRLDVASRRNDFWTNHAQCLTPRGARALLNLTDACISTRGRGVDYFVSRACHSKSLHCVDQQRFFGQDRRRVSSYLHDARDRYIGP